MRRSRRTRRRLGAVLASAMLLAIAPPAAADTLPPNTKGSATSLQSSLGSVNPQITTSGAVGGLINGLISGTVTQLFNALQGLPNSVLTPILSALQGGSPSASEPAGSTGGHDITTKPSPCAAPNCYHSLSPALNTGIANVGIGTLEGWVLYDSAHVQPDGTTVLPTIQSTGTVTDLGLGILGVDLVRLGTITATSTCPLGGTSSGKGSFTDSSILGGLVHLRNTVGQLEIAVGNSPTFSVLSSVLPLTLPFGSKQVTLTNHSGALQVGVPVGLNDLLGALGLPALTSLIDSTVQLTLTLGAISSDTTPSTTAQSWGLELGLDLAIHISAGIPGVAVINLDAPSGISGSSYGNIADLKLGYSSCSAGDVLPTPPITWIPPELN